MRDFGEKNDGVLISHIQKEDARNDDTQTVGDKIDDTPIRPSNQLGLFTENKNLAQKDIQKPKEVLWEREQNSVKQASQGEGEQKETIKLIPKKG